MLEPTQVITGKNAWRSKLWIGTELLADATFWSQRIQKKTKIAVVTENNVFSALGQQLMQGLSQHQVVLQVLPAGEASKSRSQKAALEDAWFAAELGRDAVVIALGGGVIGDLAGFAAATYMRGLPIIQVPTSLVAMVDSSLGGKTGIDVAAGKNLIGAFHPPTDVVADVSALKTLPDDELRYGLAEVVKHAVIADADLFAFVEQQLPAIFARQTTICQQLVVWNMRIKGQVVEQDERESDLRQILNFGHTIGHGLELLSHYQLPHGAAVSLGMVAELQLAAQVRGFATDQIRQIKQLLQAIGLPCCLKQASFLPQDVLAAMRYDKKNRAGKTRYALPNQLGQFLPQTATGGFATEVDDQQVLAALNIIFP